MKVSRTWAMPNKNTFSIPPINALIMKYISKSKVWVDPFLGNSPFKSYCCNLTNDLNPEIEAQYHLDAVEFLSKLEDNVADGVFFDPPYSPRQLAECYKNVGKTVTMFDTQSRFWGDCRREIARITKVGGISISCGWNSVGISKFHGFEINEILLVCHGGQHNDTIITIEEKKGYYLR